MLIHVKLYIIILANHIYGYGYYLNETDMDMDKIAKQFPNLLKKLHNFRANLKLHI